MLGFEEEGVLAADEVDDHLIDLDEAMVAMNGYKIDRMSFGFLDFFSFLCIYFTDSQSEMAVKGLGLLGST